MHQQETPHTTLPHTLSKSIPNIGLPNPIPHDSTVHPPKKVTKLRRQAHRLKLTATPPKFYTLTHTTLQTLQNLTKLQFNLDLSANPKTNLPQIHTAKTLSTCLHTDLDNKTVLLYGNKENTKLTLQYFNQFESNTKQGCLLVPSHELEDYRPYLQGWTLIHTLKTKSYTCVKHWTLDNSEEVTGGCNLFVFVPHTTPNVLPTPLQYTLQDKELTLTFEAKISGAKCTIGVDTFASGPGYIHPDFVKANNLHTREVTASVTLGDSSVAPCTTECLVHVQLGSFSSKAWLLVVAIPSPYQALLGDAWCKHHKARILYDKNTIEIVTPTRKHTIRATTDTDLQYHRVPNRLPPLDGTAQAAVRRRSTDGTAQAAIRETNTSHIFYLSDLRQMTWK